MQIRWAYLKRVLAGAIFGLYMAHLLYFLNPQVDVSPGRLALVTILYGLICGFLFGSLLWGLRALRVRLLGKPEAETYRAHGFGFVVLAAFIATAIYWIHLEVVRIYLPLGAVRILAKATNLITATSFALLLLWVAERNATRRISRVIFVGGVFLIVASSLFLYQRRDSYRAEEHNMVVANVGTVAGQRPIIVVAIRSLPYDWLLTIAGEGGLPFFDRAREHAYFTRMEPFPTTSERSLWASLASGKLPYRHGVTGRFSYRTPLNGADPRERFLLLPNGVGFQAWGLVPPVRRITSQGPAGDSLPFWMLFERVALRASVLNWPWTQASGASRVLTNDYFGARDPRREVQPPEYLTTARRLRQLPSSAALARFNITGAVRPQIAEALAQDLTLTAMAGESASDRNFGLDVVALDGFSDAQRALHIYLNDLPPRTSVKGEAIRAYVEQLDQMLATLARAHPDHLLVVVSPAGPSRPPLPATAWALAREAILPVDPGADDGFVLITGPGVTHHENPRSAFEVDMVPTVLFAAGLPVGRDMDGRVLTDAFDDEFLRHNALTAIQTYEAQQVIVRRPNGATAQ
ncbi:MAG: hypothetical protein ABI837_14250 [Acidobacteriota bacterium]